jgi:LEA14-like dessication related protein
MEKLIQEWTMLLDVLSECAIENNEPAIKTLKEIEGKFIAEQIEIIYKNHPYLK